MPRWPKKSKPKPPRILLPLQKIIVAKEILAGRPQKQVAADWKISRACIYKIFKQHLEYKIVWREGKEPTA